MGSPLSGERMVKAGNSLLIENKNCSESNAVMKGWSHFSIVKWKDGFKIAKIGYFYHVLFAFAKSTWIMHSSDA
jgi:hypothetical protein